MSEENKPKTEAEIRKIKRRQYEALNNAIFWANDMGLTLEEFMNLKKK
jgi:hypothetical protein